MMLAGEAVQGTYQARPQISLRLVPKSVDKSDDRMTIELSPGDPGSAEPER